MDIDLWTPIKALGCLALVAGCGIGALVVRFGPSLLQAFKGWVAAP